MSQARRSTRTIVTALSGALLVLGAGGMSVAAPLPASAPHPAALDAGGRAGTRAAAPSLAVPGDITLTVQSARSVHDGVPGLVRKGDPVATYRWLINADDTGNPGTVSAPLTDQCLPSTAASPGVPVAAANTDLATTCAWPSIRTTSSHSGIIAQGTQDDLSSTKSLHLPGGKYLISVTATDFKIDGAHFTVDGGTPQTVAVEMQPTPLPLTTLKIQVFQDSAPVDATYEVDAEQGLAGFTAHLADVFGTVSVDYYGNALCTMYQRDGAKILFDANSKPVVDPHSTGRCVSDANGIITIPNMGPNRFAATVTPPVPVAGQGYQWVQTTSLEGGHDHDIWSQEGATGFDNEVTKGAEPVPMVQFGFVKTQALPTTTSVTGEIVGRVNQQLPYIGGQNGQVGPEGLAGSKLGPVITSPWLALSDLNRGDAQVYVGRGGVDGKFDIKNVPDGSYQLTVWDDDQDFILYSYTVEVTGGTKLDVGLVTLVGWFTHLQGTIFTDANGNGVKDPGEAGVPNFTLTIRERDNSTMDQGLNTATTDANGHYDIREVYPLGKFIVLEAFNTRYQTTGVTYYGDNETAPTTKLGALVDFDFLAIIGLGGTVDWGVQPFAAGTNGGIAGTVTYDTTRNELDPAYAATESYQPGIPDVPVDLYQPVACAPVSTATCSKAGYQIGDHGALVKGLLLNSYTTESWKAPKGCTAKLYNGKPLTDQQALPEQGAAANNTCVEAPMAGIAMGASDTTDPTSASQTVNGNYGFTGSTVNLYQHGDSRNTHNLDVGAALPAGEEQDLPAADYIVSVELPQNPVATASTPSMYKVTSEADVNVFAGDSYLPQENFPPSAAQASNPPDGLPPAPMPVQPPSQQAGIIPACVGSLNIVHVSPDDNPSFVAGGGSPFEGQDRPSCQDKLVTVRAGQTTAPNFNVFTDVPIPTHFWGLTLNDLGITLDKRSANYGEALGMPYVPVGLYDWSGRLVDTVHTDFNGIYEALEPSTDTFNCPVPAGPCPNMYRFVGNDPGGIGSPNVDYNPRYRTIAATFQGWPGLYTVTDEAPTQVAATVLTPDTTVANNTVCNLPDTTPQLLSVDKPVVKLNANVAGRTVTVNGTGFGSTRGTLKVGTQTILGGTWDASGSKITFVVPGGAAAGAQPITITTAAGQGAYNSLTLQVVSGAAGAGSSPSNPAIFEVGPGKAYPAIQTAVNAAQTSSLADKLVVVYPATPTALTPRGEYLENVLVNSALHIQGVGPGGFQGTSWVPGSIIDGSGFNPDNPSGIAWLTTLTALRYTGAPAVPDAAVVTFLNPTSGPQGTTGWSASLDGFQITGGAQADFAGNVNVLTGGVQTPYGAAGALITQGGGIYVHNGVRGLKLTDNVIVGNGGSYAGGIRVGTPYVGDNGNYEISISRNQIRDNGGTNLAGGIGLFTGANGYTVDHNAICGNHSSEYGGGISAFGFMGATQKVTGTTATFSDASGGVMTNNRIWFNQSYDEGGGVMVAGELPATPTDLSPGSGPVVIDANVIQANLANDDGGGVRLLQVSGKNVTRATPGTISITNNTIANNVSAHEGGGIALDDAVFVNIVNDTIAKNITTATAVTSNGAPAAAGLTTAATSAPLQAQLNTAFGGATTGTTNNSLLVQGTPAWLGFGRPTLLNDVFWDNRAGNYVGGYVYGIGGLLPNGAANSTNTWDMEVVDQASGATAPAVLSPVNSVVQTTTGVATSSSNTNLDPQFKSPFDVTVSVLALRANPAFRQAAIVTTVLPFNLLGDYHLSGPGSSAYSRGAADFTNLAAPAPRAMWWGVPRTSATFSYAVLAATPDIDGQARPVRRALGAAGLKYDAGSDQVVP